MRVLLLTILMIYSLALSGQVPDIKVKGKITEAGNNDIGGYIMVVNLKTGRGISAGPDGTFEITIPKNDTLAFASIGYTTLKICFRDSVLKSEYTLHLKLHKLQKQLREVVVRPQKSLDEVRNEIRKLGTHTEAIESKRSSIQSPISMLYEEFSRRERAKRKLAELQDEMQRRDILKDYIHMCMKGGLINLAEEEVEDFIDYFSVTDYFLRNSNDYDILFEIKIRYREFENLPSHKILRKDSQ